MRRVYALLGLAKKYGAARLDEACTVALDAEMLDIHRLQRMLEAGRTQPALPGIAPDVPIARHLRPKEHYRLPLPGLGSKETRDDA